MAFSVSERDQNIKAMQEEEFDLLIIGGGISGAGVARDAASRGMRVALVEARDYAEGTSSRSSKLVHGGIRYLENLEFGLVFEALTERRNLFEIAPHLVHPLRFILPLYKGSRVGMFKLGLGMMLYDLLAAFEMPQMHERLNPDDLKMRTPMLDQKDLVGGYAYSDAYMDDDRLVIETLRSAAEHGAVCANFVSAIGVENPAHVQKVRCRNILSGEEFWVRAKHTVSTVGPWTDQLAHSFFSDWKKIMRPSKGVHLTFDRSRIPIQDAVVMITEDEKRIVFAIPRHEMVIIGTTDTDFKESPENVHTTRADVDYLLWVAGSYFPNAKLNESDILASYAGVRPLVDDGSQTESKTSREHLILSDPRNVTFLTGGKYTTYRRMAEQTMDVVLSSFAIEERVKYSKSKTLEPLNKMATVAGINRAHQMAAQISKQSGLDVGDVHMLVDRHGLEALEIIEKGRAAGLKNYWQLEARHAIESTMCLRLIDFYLRRSHLFLAQKDHGEKQLALIADVFEQTLGWNKSKKEQELNALRAHTQFEMGWHS